MAGKKTKTPQSTTRFPIGNCEVLIKGSAKCESNRDRLHISASRAAKITVSVSEGEARAGCEGVHEGDSGYADCQFLLINPKDADSSSKCLLKEVLELYMKELPGMNYAANTGKQSAFLERCVLNGKYCTLLLRCLSGDSAKVVGAVTYQIIPADTQYAEIPLAAVGSMHQRKGIGCQLYMELSRRLRDVGICTILCWGDKESEGFWHKQGFVSIAEVDSKGKARKLPIRAGIRKALCFPGGSTLLVSHLKNSHDASDNTVKLPTTSKPGETLYLSAKEMHDDECNVETAAPLIAENQILAEVQTLQTETPGLPGDNLTSASRDVSPCEVIANPVADYGDAKSGARKASTISSFKENRKRIWESSSSSLKSKRVKASRLADNESYSASAFDFDSEIKNGSHDDGCALFSQRVEDSRKSRVGRSPVAGHMPRSVKEHTSAEPTCKDLTTVESKLKDTTFSIMLMDIGDSAKKLQLTKIIDDLSGAVTADGSLATHVLTGKVRRTLNFCTALCGGAWILSPSWLKASFREGRFVDEMPFILEDKEYSMKFRIDLKDAVLRARKSPKALLKGYSICLSAHVLPPRHTLSTIVLSAGGNVIHGYVEVCDNTRAIFVACEEDMEEALLAVGNGIRTFNNDWFINCIMKQELDLEAPQFAESL